jgi:DNA-binding transcriptional LysR family regulator
MSHNFDLHRLRLLRELKHRGTITAVAAAMSYSHSAVSQQLSVLEDELGAQLLEPDGRRVRLTVQGEVLVHHVEAILERLDQADADLALARGDVAGTLRIATFQTVMMALMPSVLTTLRVVHPRLTIELAHADPDAALSGLQAREFDLVVDEVFAGQPLVRSTAVDKAVLHRDPIRLAVPLAGSHLTDAERVSDLAGADWVMEPAGSAAREWTERICHAAGFRPSVRFESPDMLVHERLVRGGHAVAFLPDLLWVEAPPAICLRELSDGGYRDIVCSVRAGTSKHPSVRAAKSALRAACAAADSAITVNLAAPPSQYGDPGHGTA